MGLGECVVDAKCLRDSGPGFGHRLVWRLASHQRDLQREHDPRVGDANVRECVMSIEPDCTLEVLDRPVAALRGPLAPEKAALQIELIRLHVLGLASRERLSFGA